MIHKTRALFGIAGLALCAALAAPAAFAALSISQAPLFLTIALPPNITVLLDDSGSLAWAYVPDALGGNAAARIYENYSTTSTSCATGLTLTKISGKSYCIGYKSVTSVYTPDTFQFKSSTFNPLAYNPNVTYTAPYNDSGVQLTTSFSAAYINGFDTADGTINMTTGYQTTVEYDPSNSFDSIDSSCNSFGKFASCNSSGAQAAYYYTYTPTSTSAVANGCTKVTTDDGCYTKVTVSSSSGPGGTDERQNFANWFSFYRTRNLTVASGADIAFNSLSQNYRVAWINLHTCPDFSGTNCTGWDGVTYYDNRVGVFTGQHRKDFFDWLSRFPANNGTNLRQQLEKVGAYYTTKGVDSPYAFNPHVTDSPEYVCRPNYAVVMTDGLWNESTSSLAFSPGNLDSKATTLPDGTSYPATNHPYSDGNSNTLADVAFYYWSHNLRSDLGTSTALQFMKINKNVAVKDSVGNIANVTPYWNAQNDPAQWPHMVTYTLGLGLSTALASPPSWAGDTYSGGYNDLVTGHVAWPSSYSCADVGGGCTDPIGNVYDLWHAAIDSRGEFFSVNNPTEVVDAFNSVLSRVQARVGSSSAIAVNSTRLDSNTLIYQAQFNSSDWSGEVLAYKINSDGSIGALQWKASNQIPAASSRNIFTWNNSTSAGMNFLWTNLTTNEQTALNTNLFGTVDGNGSNRLNYLRGDQSLEQNNGGTFRNRNVLLGDIVNSNPYYAGLQDYGFDVLPEGATLNASGIPVYDAFVTSKSSRTPVLYVGANDGMLHAVNANTGAEMFAFVPRGVYGNLSALTDPTYVHQYYVDGSPQSVDAYFGSTPTWHTLLAATSGAGAREVFMLDVTTPNSETAANVLYDYDGASLGDNNMGYSLGQATIARMNDGNWYLIWGNGYNSPNQHAVLYMYNINAAKLTTFDTGVGSSTSPNGMSAPAPVDTTNDRIADTIYAGDLQGNLWKLDVSSSNASQWGFAFGSKTTPAPLFTAKDASSNVQPITDKPQVGLNKNGQVTVYFGTGTYFQTSDNTVPSSPPVQSFYGIIDSGSQITGRSNLLQQFIVSQQTINGNNFRITTAYTLSSSQSGWYMDFNYPVAQGERVVSDAVLDSGRIIFTTLIPQGNACAFGGTSWLMELDTTSGSQLTVSPLDVNGDGKVNNNDFVTVTYTDPTSGKSVTASVPVSGEQSNVGIIKTPGIISAGDLQYKYFSGSTGTIGSTVESNPTSGGRLSWQQLQ